MISVNDKLTNPWFAVTSDGVAIERYSKKPNGVNNVYPIGLDMRKYVGFEWRENGTNDEYVPAMDGEEQLLTPNPRYEKELPDSHLKFQYPTITVRYRVLDRKPNTDNMSQVRCLGLNTDKIETNYKQWVETVMVDEQKVKYECRVENGTKLPEMTFHDPESRKDAFIFEMSLYASFMVKDGDRLETLAFGNDGIPTSISEFSLTEEVDEETVMRDVADISETTRFVHTDDGEASNEAIDTYGSEADSYWKKVLRSVSKDIFDGIVGGEKFTEALNELPWFIERSGRKFTDAITNDIDLRNVHVINGKVIEVLCTYFTVYGSNGEEKKYFLAPTATAGRPVHQPTMPDIVLYLNDMTTDCIDNVYDVDVKSDDVLGEIITYTPVEGPFVDAL